MLATLRLSMLTPERMVEFSSVPSVWIRPMPAAALIVTGFSASPMSLPRMLSDLMSRPEIMSPSRSPLRMEMVPNPPSADRVCPAVTPPPVMFIRSTRPFVAVTFASRSPPLTETDLMFPSVAVMSPLMLPFRTDTVPIETAVTSPRIDPPLTLIPPIDP